MNGIDGADQQTSLGDRRRAGETGRLLALDVGTVRIGVAVSDATGMVVSPLTVIRTRPTAVALEEIVRLAIQEEAIGIIVGLPVFASGDHSTQTQTVIDFIANLRAQLAQTFAGTNMLPVQTWDERYTTVEAERILREQGVRRDRWRERIDAIAAGVILQDFLDANPPQAPVSVPPTVD